MKTIGSFGTGHAGFGGVVGVVQADADELADLPDARTDARRAVRRAAASPDRAVRSRASDVRQQRVAGDVRHDAGQIAMIANRAGRAFPPGSVTQKFHGFSVTGQLPVVGAVSRAGLLSADELAAAARSVRFARDLVAAAADEKIEIGALIRLLHVLDVELRVAARRHDRLAASATRRAAAPAPRR